MPVNVVRAALRTLKRQEQPFEAMLVTLRATIEQGDASGVAEGDSFGRVRHKLQLPKKRR